MQQLRTGHDGHRFLTAWTHWHIRGLPEPDSIDYAVMEKTDRAVSRDSPRRRLVRYRHLVGHLGGVWTRTPPGMCCRETPMRWIRITRSCFLGTECLPRSAFVTPGYRRNAGCRACGCTRIIRSVRRHCQPTQDRQAPRTHSCIAASIVLGSYEGWTPVSRFQVKRLTVKPGASPVVATASQRRAEHWVVVRGHARVTRGDDVFLLSENQSTYIPIGTTPAGESGRYAAGDLRSAVRKLPR